jgi:translation initiation factor IF-3
LLHHERGEAILLKLADELKELAIVESRPNLDGRNMVMMLAPVKNLPPEGGADSEASESPPVEAPESPPVEAPESPPVEAPVVPVEAETAAS